MVATNSTSVQALEVIQTTVRQVGEALGMPNFTLSDLIKVYGALGVEVESPKATPTPSTKVSGAKGTKTAKGKDWGKTPHQLRRTATQRVGDIKVDVRKSIGGKRYSWRHMPLDLLFDGNQHTVMIPTSNRKIVDLSVLHLRKEAGKLGLGVKVKLVNLNRYTVELSELRPLGKRSHLLEA